MAENNNTNIAGSIEWDDLFLNIAGGASIDLRPFVQHIKIYENIFQHCLFVEMALAESANILGRLSISGNSTVTMKLRSPFLDDDAAIHKTFGLFSVSDRVVRDDRRQFFIMHLMSLEGVKDLSTRFSKRFTGATEDIAQEIYQDNIKEKRIRSEDGSFSGNTDLVILGTPHKTNNFSFTATNWSAFECMEFIAKNVEPADYSGKLVMPNSLFFETRNEFIMGSLTELIHIQKEAKALYDEYSYLPTGDVKFLEGEERITSGGYQYTSPFVSQKYSTVSMCDMKDYFNELSNQQSGYYGSTTVGVDLTTRMNYHMIFDYTDTLSDEQYRNKIPKKYEDFIHLADERPTTEYPIFSPAAVTTVRIGTTNLYQDSDFGYDIAHFEKLTYRNTANAEMRRLSMRIEVPGKTDISVGKLIRFNFPNIGEKLTGVTREEVFDPKISGVWAVIGIVHNITQTQHTMILEIVRDSFGDDDA